MVSNFEYHSRIFKIQHRILLRYTQLFFIAGLKCYEAITALTLVLDMKTYKRVWKHNAPTFT